MRERAEIVGGTLNIKSGKHGTHLTAKVPL
jgi:signal transduction histidine kinase